MRLRTLRVQNFKSIEDSTEFSVGDVICLVGKNESGKTAILEALYKLNPVVGADAKYDTLDSFPRRKLNAAQESGTADKASVVNSTWELQDADVQAVSAALGADVLKGRTVEIEKGYANSRNWTLPIEETRLVSHYLNEAKLADEERTPLDGCATIDSVVDTLRGLPSATAAQQALLTTLGQRFDKDPQEKARDALAKQLPKFLYFDRYYVLQGMVSINQWIAKKGNNTLTNDDRVFEALLELVGMTPEEVRDLASTEKLIAQLEAISNRISDEIFAYWSQNKHLQVQFRCEPGRAEDEPPFNAGYVFQTRIRNDRHKVSLNFDERSSGFVWFFSFLIWFWQVRRHHGTNVFLLLDEPALNLHARAQADLLRYIKEQLKPHHQVIYTTHSPSLVDADNILSARTVEDVVTPDGTVEGTKVGDRVLSTDPDTVSPLQGALGLDITQTLFVGKHTLLVEGPADFLYLTWASAELGSRGRTKLDPRWVISPAGGLDKVGSFVTLFAGNKLHVAVLADYHHGEKKKVRDLRESKLLRDGHVFTAETYAGQAEADIEDIVGRANYIALVNETFGLTGDRQLPAPRPADAPVRVVSEAERHFAVLPPEAPAFDHYAPAAHLIAEAARLRGALPELDAALNRFEQLFRDLNAIMPGAS